MCGSCVQPASLFCPRPWLGLDADQVAQLWAWMNEAMCAALKAGRFTVASFATADASADAADLPPRSLVRALATERFFTVSDPLLPAGMSPCMHLLADNLAHELSSMTTNDVIKQYHSEMFYTLVALTSFSPGQWHPLVTALEPVAQALATLLPAHQLRAHARVMVLVSHCTHSAHGG